MRHLQLTPILILLWAATHSFGFTAQTTLKQVEKVCYDRFAFLAVVAGNTGSEADKKKVDEIRAELLKGSAALRNKNKKEATTSLRSSFEQIKELLFVFAERYRDRTKEISERATKAFLDRRLTLETARNRNIKENREVSQADSFLKIAYRHQNDGVHFLRKGDYIRSITGFRLAKAYSIDALVVLDAKKAKEIQTEFKQDIADNLQARSE